MRELLGDVAIAGVQTEHSNEARKFRFAERHQVGCRFHLQLKSFPLNTLESTLEMHGGLISRQVLRIGGFDAVLAARHVSELVLRSGCLGNARPEDRRSHNLVFKDKVAQGLLLNFTHWFPKSREQLSSRHNFRNCLSVSNSFLVAPNL